MGKLTNEEHEYAVKLATVLAMVLKACDALRLPGIVLHSLGRILTDLSPEGTTSKEEMESMLDNEARTAMAILKANKPKGKGKGKAD